MKEYKVHWQLTKGNSRRSGFKTVKAESDFMAAKIAEGAVRKEQPGSAEYVFVVLGIERRQ